MTRVQRLWRCYLKVCHNSVSNIHFTVVIPAQAGIHHKCKSVFVMDTPPARSMTIII